MNLCCVHSSKLHRSSWWQVFLTYLLWRGIKTHPCFHTSICPPMKQSLGPTEWRPCVRGGPLARCNPFCFAPFPSSALMVISRAAVVPPKKNDITEASDMVSLGNVDSSCGGSANDLLTSATQSWRTPGSSTSTLVSSSKTVVASSLRKRGVCTSPRWSAPTLATTPVWSTTLWPGTKCSALRHRSSSEVMVKAKMVFVWATTMFSGPEEREKKELFIPAHLHYFTHINCKPGNLNTWRFSNGGKKNRLNGL